MKKPADPRELAIAILERSPCRIKVGAVLADDWGIHSWGWNSAGPDGYGQHAEEHCLSRANRRRLPMSTLYVAACRTRNSGTKGVVTAKPCPDCARFLRGIPVVYRDGSGTWQEA